MSEIRIGCSGWVYKDGTGPFYPPEVKDRARLAFYASRFDTAEINASFYRLPTGTYPNPALPVERRLSWLFAIDPYIHSRMSAEWHALRDKAWDDPQCLAVAGTAYEVCFCPANPATDTAVLRNWRRYTGLLLLAFHHTNNPCLPIRVTAASRGPGESDGNAPAAPTGIPLLCLCRTAWRMDEATDNWAAA